MKLWKTAMYMCVSVWNFCNSWLNNADRYQVFCGMLRTWARGLLPFLMQKHSPIAKEGTWCIAFRLDFSLSYVYVFDYKFNTIVCLINYNAVHPWVWPIFDISLSLDVKVENETWEDIPWHTKKTRFPIHDKLLIWEIIECCTLE